jgi:biopolymer transport protein ExbD
MPVVPRAVTDPISDLNTTPLIDVMLVLIIMLIITIPPQTHRVALDLPGKPIVPVVNPVRNVLAIDEDGAASWNGRPISDASLQATLAEVGQMQRSPELHFRPDSEARYERVDDVLAMTKRAQVTKLGFVGNERYAAF